LGLFTKPPPGSCGSGWGVVMAARDEWRSHGRAWGFAYSFAPGLRGSSTTAVCRFESSKSRFDTPLIPLVREETHAWLERGILWLSAFVWAA